MQRIFKASLPRRTLIDDR